MQQLRKKGPFCTDMQTMNKLRKLRKVTETANPIGEESDESESSIYRIERVNRIIDRKILHDNSENQRNGKRIHY